MVEIPGGTFTMGSDSQDANENEKPVHSVSVKSFQLDRTEVTVQAFAECVRVGACSEPDAYREERGNFHIFCNWKNHRIARPPDQLRRFPASHGLLRLGQQALAH